MNKIIFLLIGIIFSNQAYSFETIDSAMAEMKKTGIVLNGNAYKCPSGFNASEEMSPAPESFSKKQCKKAVSKDHEIMIQVELITPAKKNRIGRIFVTVTNFTKGARPCTVDTLRQVIEPHKALKTVNQFISFDLGKDFVASVSCPGVGNGYFLDVQTAFWKELMK